MLNNFFYKKVSGVPVHTWLLFCGICLVGYWPVSSNLFSLKNDALVYFLPCRYFISESIQSGHLPLWSPYFYMGFPMHGDMQSGAWNPIVILISLFGKYNMTTLQFETLLYIFIAGIGMYKLLNIVGSGHFTKLVVGVAYMFCGFIIDTGQITVWTGSAAFIPFVFLYYHRILFQREQVYKNALKSAIAFYFLLTAGYPSFFIMCCYILFAGVLAFCLSQYRKKDFDRHFVFLLIEANAVIAIAFLLISLPALLSYLDYFPYYQRSSGTTLQQAQENPFNLFGTISYLFPLSVTRDHHWLNTNLTARSAYIGLFALVMLAGIFRKKRTGLQQFILSVIVFLFLFSLGDTVPVREFCYHYLPLMNLFRHPGTMRLFTTIGLLLLSSIYTDDFFVALKEKRVKFYLQFSYAMILLISIISIINFKSSSIPGKIASVVQTVFSTANIRVFLKDFYERFSFSDAIILEGLIQVFFLLLFVFLIKRCRIGQTKVMVALFIINPVLLAQFSIPSTFVTRQPPSAINHFISTTPDKYPVPDVNEKIIENNAVENESYRQYGLASFYTKKIVHAKEEINPSYTKSLRAFDSASIISSILMQYPICYFADTLVHYNNDLALRAGTKKILFADDSISATSVIDTVVSTAFIRITQFAPWGLSFETNTQESKPFVLFQNFNKNWKLSIDGKNAVIKKGNISFMYANVEKGQHILQFYYRPGYLTYSIAVSLFSVLLITLFLTINRKRKL